MADLSLVAELIWGIAEECPGQVDFAIASSERSLAMPDTMQECDAMHRAHVLRGCATRPA